jgi:hypothetical protein
MGTPKFEEEKFDDIDVNTAQNKPLLPKAVTNIIGATMIGLAVLPNDAQSFDPEFPTDTLIANQDGAAILWVSGDPNGPVHGRSIIDSNRDSGESVDLYDAEKKTHVDVTDAVLDAVGYDAGDRLELESITITDSNGDGIGDGGSVRIVNRDQHESTVHDYNALLANSSVSFSTLNGAGMGVMGGRGLDGYEYHVEYVTEDDSSENGIYQGGTAENPTTLTEIWTEEGGKIFGLGPIDSDNHLVSYSTNVDLRLLSRDSGSWVLGDSVGNGWVSDVVPANLSTFDYRTFSISDENYEAKVLIDLDAPVEVEDDTTPEIEGLVVDTEDHTGGEMFVDCNLNEVALTVYASDSADDPLTVQGVWNAPSKPDKDVDFIEGEKGVFTATVTIEDCDGSVDLILTADDGSNSTTVDYSFDVSDVLDGTKKPETSLVRGGYYETLTGTRVLVSPDVDYATYYEEDGVSTFEVTGDVEDALTFEEMQEVVRASIPEAGAEGVTVEFKPSDEGATAGMSTGGVWGGGSGWEAPSPPPPGEVLNSSLVDATSLDQMAAIVNGSDYTFIGGLDGQLGEDSLDGYRAASDHFKASSESNTDDPEGPDEGTPEQTTEEKNNPEETGTGCSTVPNGGGKAAGILVGLVGLIGMRRRKQ